MNILLSRASVNLLKKLSELASDVSGVAIQNWCISSTDLTGVIEDNDLGIERVAALGRIILGVSAYVTTSDFLDRDVLDVEPDIVTRETLNQSFVVHFDGLDFSGDVGRGESDNHTGLDDSGFNTADGDCSNTTNFVDILERETEGLVGRSDGWLNGVDGFKESESLGCGGLGLLLPTLEPGHVGGLLDHVVTVPSRDGDEGNSLGVVSCVSAR
jgi:hypothetical protein